MSGAPAIERILLVRLSAMGDVLQSLFALRALRAARPDAQIAWAVERRFAGLVEGHPSIDRLFVLERSKAAGLVSNVRAFLRLRREIRDWQPDVAVDLQGNLRGGLVSWTSGAARRIALPAGEAREGAQRFATEVVPAATDPREHRADRAVRLIAPLRSANPDAPDAPDADPSSAVALLPPVPDTAAAAVTRELAGLGLVRDDGVLPFALFVAGTSDFGAFKRWPAEKFGLLAARMGREARLPVLVSYGPGQESLAAAIVAAAAGSARPAPATRSLPELRALLGSAALVVGADSGPVVLAGMTGRPTVTLFGPKDPVVYEGRGAATAVVWKGVYCSPCRLRRCDDPICMTEIQPDEVWEGARRALEAEAATR